MALSNFIVELLSKSIADAGESKLKEILQKLHDTNKEDYKAAIYGGYALVSHLKPYVEKTKTNIDDALLQAIEEAIKTSASDNGIEDIPVIKQP